MILDQPGDSSGYVEVLRPRAAMEMHSMFGRTVLPFVIREPIYELDYEGSISQLEAALRRLREGLPPEQSPTKLRHPV